jgi:hypothetical protein
MDLRRWHRLVAMSLARAFSGHISLDAISPYQGFTWTNFSVYTNTPGNPAR